MTATCHGARCHTEAVAAIGTGAGSGMAAAPVDVPGAGIALMAAIPPGAAIIAVMTTLIHTIAAIITVW